MTNRINPTFGVELTVADTDAGTITLAAAPGRELGPCDLSPTPETVLACTLERLRVTRYPAAWRPIIGELGRRLHTDRTCPDWAWVAGALNVRPVDHPGRRDEGWQRYRDPQAAALALGLDVERKPAGRFLQTAKAKAEAKAARPAPKPRVRTKPAPAPEPAADLPAWAVDYLGRLVFPDKAEYAAALLRHLLCGGPRPKRPEGDWAEKTERRIAFLSKQNHVGMAVAV